MGYEVVVSAQSSQVQSSEPRLRRAASHPVVNARSRPDQERTQHASTGDRAQIHSTRSTGCEYSVATLPSSEPVVVVRRGPLAFHCGSNHLRNVEVSA